MKVKWFDIPLVPFFYVLKGIFHLRDKIHEVVGTIGIISYVIGPILLFYDLLGIDSSNPDDLLGGFVALGWMLFVMLIIARYIFGGYDKSG